MVYSLAPKATCHKPAPLRRTGFLVKTTRKRLAVRWRDSGSSEALSRPPLNWVIWHFFFFSFSFYKVESWPQVRHSLKNLAASSQFTRTRQSLGAGLCHVGRTPAEITAGLAHRSANSGLLTRHWHPQISAPGVWVENATGMSHQAGSGSISTMYQFPISLQRTGCLLCWLSGAFCAVFISLFSCVCLFLSTLKLYSGGYSRFEIIRLERLW